MSGDVDIDIARAAADVARCEQRAERADAALSAAEDEHAAARLDLNRAKRMLREANRAVIEQAKEESS